MKTILVPIDFSRHSGYTARFGLELAHQIDADVLLLHVVQPAPSAPILSIPPVDLAAWNQPMYDQKNTEIQRVERELTAYKQQQGFSGGAIRSQIVVGQPADSILEIARVEHASFIVMGTVGTSSAWGKMLGSVTSDVAQRTDQPLWIIPNAVPLDSLRQFAYFADLEGDEVSCIQQVIDLGKQLRVSMNVVHVSAADEDEFSQAEALIDAFEVSYAQERITFDNLVYDSVGEGIEAYTRMHWPDAVVLAHQHRGLISRLFHKSVIRALSLTTRRPLLIIQKPAI